MKNDKKTCKLEFNKFVVVESKVLKKNCIVNQTTTILGFFSLPIGGNESVAAVVSLLLLTIVVSSSNEMNQQRKKRISIKWLFYLKTSTNR